MAGKKSNSVETIRRPPQVIPGRNVDPQVAQHTVDRSYRILRELENQKLQAGVTDLDDLSDVNAPAPANGNVLTWVTADNEWEALPPASGGIQSYSSTEATRPAGNPGDLFYPADGFQIERKNGGVWSPWGPLFPFTPPVPGNFAWVNQGIGGNAGVLTTVNGGMSIRAQGKVTSHARCQMATAPATPYTITAFVLTTCPAFFGISGSRAGLVFRDSAGGRMVSMHRESGNLTFSKWNGADLDINATYTSPGMGSNTGWWQVRDDGTSLIFSVSEDGVNFMEVFEALRHDWLAAGPDQVGFFADSAVSSAGNVYNTIFCTLLSWKAGP
jgi:hypothetical protein